MNKPITLGLAEFEIRNEFGVYKIFAGGYGRSVRQVAVLDGARAASLVNMLATRGIEDATVDKTAPPPSTQDVP